jgi:predicted transcriptional regulator
MSTRAPRPEQLTRREREIMHAVFALDNRASAEAIQAQLTNPPSYSAVRTMLGRLEQKGYLRHAEEGHRYMYSATTSPAVAKRAALEQYVRVFFGGSLSSMVTSLVRDETWTADDLDALHTEVERVRREKGRR